MSAKKLILRLKVAAILKVARTNMVVIRILQNADTKYSKVRGCPHTTSHKLFTSLPLTTPPPRHYTNDTTTPSHSTPPRHYTNDTTTPSHSTPPRRHIPHHHATTFHTTTPPHSTPPRRHIPHHHATTFHTTTPPHSTPPHFQIKPEFSFEMNKFFPTIKLPAS